MVLTNVYGAALTVRATLPALKESRGHLLITGSVAGRRALPGSLYSCTKWAITAMGEAVRAEIDGAGIRVTVIEPGMVDTPFFDNPVEGALHPEDIARAVMYAVEPARARRRQRDPRAAGLAELLTGLQHPGVRARFAAWPAMCNTPGSELVSPHGRRCGISSSDPRCCVARCRCDP